MIRGSMASIGTVVRHDMGASDLCVMSRASLERPLVHPAELVVAVPTDEGLVFGAHQRKSELGMDFTTTLPLDRRGSGGAEARVGPGTVWLQLALATSSALVQCPPERLINRYVRPLLRAITALGVVAHYFERDWVSGAKRPVAALGFAHDGTTGRAFVEAIVAVTTPHAIRSRASTMGKEPTTLAELGMRADPSALADAVVASYAGAYGVPATSFEPAPLPLEADEIEGLADEPPWTSTRLEAIGLVGAGADRRGRLRVGGELMVSRDALRRLEAGLATLAPSSDVEAIGALVDDTLGAPGVALFGVRSLRSIRDVIASALPT